MSSALFPFKKTNGNPKSQDQAAWRAKTLANNQKRVGLWIATMKKKSQKIFPQLFGISSPRRFLKQASKNNKSIVLFNS